ncbi:MAG: hypothetical protein AAGG51_03445 [Cyanobacteria bacterium P01_G01_bin.54]
MAFACTVPDALKQLPKPPKPRFPLGLLPLAVLASVGLHIWLLRIAVPETEWDIEEPEREEILIPITTTSLPTPTPTPEPSPTSTPTPTPTPEPSPTPEPPTSSDADESLNIALNSPPVPSTNEQNGQTPETSPSPTPTPSSVPTGPPEPTFTTFNPTEVNANAEIGCFNADDCASVAGSGNFNTTVDDFKQAYLEKGYTFLSEKYDQGGVTINEFESPQGNIIYLGIYNDLLNDRIIIAVTDRYIEDRDDLENYYQ